MASISRLTRRASASVSSNSLAISVGMWGTRGLSVQWFSGVAGWSMRALRRTLPRWRTRSAVGIRSGLPGRRNHRFRSVFRPAWTHLPVGARGSLITGKDLRAVGSSTLSTRCIQRWHSWARKSRTRHQSGCRRPCLSAGSRAPPAAPALTRLADCRTERDVHITTRLVVDRPTWPQLSRQLVRPIRSAGAGMWNWLWGKRTRSRHRAPIAASSRRTRRGVGVAIGIVGVICGPRRGERAAHYRARRNPPHGHPTTMANQC
jgi:hypothetical protein